MQSERAYYFQVLTPLFLIPQSMPPIHIPIPVVQRSPLAFEAVFQYYANGVVHKPPELCPSAFSAELEFWRVPTSYIGQSINSTAILNCLRPQMPPKCHPNPMPMAGACCSDSVSPLERLLESNKEDKVDDTTFEKLWCGRFRRRMWTFLERPGSSMQANTNQLRNAMTAISQSKFHPSGQGLRAVLHNVRVDLRPGPQLWHNSGLPGGREGRSEHVLVKCVPMTYADQLPPLLPLVR